MFTIWVTFGLLGPSYYQTPYRGFADQLFYHFANNGLKTHITFNDKIVDSYDPAESKPG